MKKIKNNIILATCLVAVFSGALLSFTPIAPGGDSFKVYLNDKLVLEQYVHGMKTVPNLKLVQSSVNDKIDVYYSHCGKGGKSRYITIQNGKNQPLKVWQFGDSKGTDNAMSFKLNEIAALQQKASDKELQLFYSSKELPEGRELANLAIENSSLATRK
jgi:hypothetical protein